MRRHILFVLFLGLNSLYSFALPTELTVPTEVKKKYATLYTLPVEKTPDGGRAFHQGRLYYRDGLRIISLKGDRFEMAFQHGRLLKEEIHAGAVPVTASLLGNNAKNSFPNLPFVTNLLIKAVYELFPDRTLRHLQKKHTPLMNELSHDAWGLSESSGLGVDQVVYAVLAPESIMTLFGSVAESPLLNSPTPLANACSEFVVTGDRSSTGKLIIGRNTDYGLNGYYDNFPTAIYLEPTDGSQKYLTLGSAGTHIAGILGINESGIYLGAHLIPTLDVNTNALPLFIFGQQVLRKARSFDEALQILSENRPGSGWTYVLASTKENRVASVEFTNHSFAVREMKGDFHVQTNHFMTNEVAKNNYDINHAVYTDTHARYDRLMELVEKGGVITPKKAALIMGDKTDPYSKKVRGVGNTVSVHTTLTSAVIDGANSKIYVATGKAPVSQNRYVEIPFPGNLNFGSVLEQNYGILPSINYKQSHTLLADAEQEFIQAKIAFEIKMDLNQAETHMQEAVELDPENPHYSFSLAIIKMKMGTPDAALPYLENVLHLDDLHLRSVAHYFIGRIKGAKLFQRGEALSHLEYAFENANHSTEKKLKDAAKKAINKVKTLGVYAFDSKKVSYLMQEGDCISY